MENKTIKIISPITIAVIIVFDIATIACGVFAVKKVIELHSTFSYIFLFFEIIAIILAVFVTKQTLSEGAVFRADEVEFTAIDENSIFKYEDIQEINLQKDEEISFVKNFIDRHAVISIKNKDGKTFEIDLGLTTKYTLELIGKEISKRAEIEMPNTITHPKKQKKSNKTENKNSIDNVSKVEKIDKDDDDDFNDNNENH